MACNCIPNVIQSSQPDCVNCIKAVSLRYLCSDGPSPCGDTLVQDLAEYNDISACACGTAVYSVEEFDTDAFSSVTITSAGVITITTTSNFVAKEDYLVVYKVDCPCSILSATGNIYVCMKDLCAGVDCGAGEFCNPCDGTCDPAVSDLDIDDGGVMTHSSGGTGFA